MFAVACATPSALPIEHEQRIKRAGEHLENDPTLQAHRAAVEAALANERRPKLVDAVELRAGEDYLDGDHQVRALARIKLRNPVELRAERAALRAQTAIEVTRLEQASLDRRVALCFPSVEALVHDQQSMIFTGYADRQKILLDWNDDWRASGVVDELSGTRFELDSRIKLATRQPQPIAQQPHAEMQLPEIGAGGGELVRSAEQLRAAVREHHPSVGLRDATAERYRRLVDRARARRLPGLRFVDLSYEYRSDGSQDGVGGQVAFDIPFGGQALAEIGRFEALGRQQRSEANALVEDQISLSLQALNDVHDFESRTEQWRELEQLAARAEQVADRWWKGRLAKPTQVAALLDNAYAARIAVLEARERAASAACTLLAMTGISLDAWPRR
ncbi:MAG: TolC family protein [Myxococcota bacterium]